MLSPRNLKHHSGHNLMSRITSFFLRMRIKTESTSCNFCYSIVVLIIYKGRGTIRISWGTAKLDMVM